MKIANIQAYGEVYNSFLKIILSQHIAQNATSFMRTMTSRKTLSFLRKYENCHAKRR